MAPCPRNPLPRPVEAALARIRTRILAGHVAWLASPAREGRGLGSRGLEEAADHVADLLARAGLAPLGGSRFQAVPLREIRDLEGGLTIQLPGRSFPLVHGRTCRLPEREPQVLEAPLVFAGYGIQEPALGHDDYRDLDVKGKVVLLVAALPPGPQWRSAELVARYGGPGDRTAARVACLDRLGARAVIALEEGTLPPALPAPPFFRAAEGVPSTDEPPLVRVPMEGARDLLAALGVDPAHPDSLRPRIPPSATATLTLAGAARPARSRNVLGFLEGSDPVLRREAVVLGAHLDHLGLRGGVLHPGADDNASGVAALLEIARAFAAGPRPRRSLVFAFWTGEEDGEFGSGHYVRHPLWPLDRTLAYLNLDMIGHPWTREELGRLEAELDPGGRLLGGVDPERFAEPGLADWAPWLGPVLARAGRGTGMALHLDRTDGRSGGSDYRDFARAKVPFVRFFGDYFPAYHEPGDTAASLDAAQVRRMARLALATAWLLAGPPPAPPRRTTPGP